LDVVQPWSQRRSTERVDAFERRDLGQDVDDLLGQGPGYRRAAEVLDPDECAWSKRTQAITLKFKAARHAISGWRSDTASLMAAAGHRASAGDLGALTPFMVVKPSDRHHVQAG